MNALEKRTIILKDFLKPLFKQEGFSTSGNYWWKDFEHHFILIHFQNSQHNHIDSAAFCLNCSLGLKILLENDTKRWNAWPQFYWREADVLPESRHFSGYRKDGGLGYSIKEETDMDNFTAELSEDLDKYVFPFLNRLNSLKEALDILDRELKPEGQTYGLRNEIKKRNIPMD